METQRTTLDITKTSATRINEVDFDNLAFGKHCSDHMMICDYKDGKWQTPQVLPYGPIPMEPSAKVFHYGQAVFEGMKAFKDEDDKIWLFRPEDNFKRINISAERLAMPAFPKEYFFEALETILELDKDWIKKGKGNSLYIRPFVIGTENGVSASPSSEYRFIIICCPAKAYYSNPVKVTIAQKYSRSADGGVGYAKAAGNYAAQFYPTNLAKEKGYDQVIWTDANTHEYLEECGTMNVFFRVGDKLITAPTNDRILDGITRKSIIALAEEEGVDVEVRRVAVREIVEAAKNGALKEIFGAGTAATIVPFLGFDFNDNYYELPEIENSYGAKFKKMLQDIQYNLAEDKFGWTYEVK
ncbi:branched-chain amino acid aminotransferase [Mesonia aestuariivivens]|uniref:Branched-chain-amino-acid aminotransferase n=1 Tax=Mesonia aestuariivivens TaxID=2796128 RepID=A0ABS6W3Y0_9FLAO|nr:branched-chain amino acid aminotransferase [Mesonia aestuariivivens]MBW2962570.1 branched-chain amino acid aminotransferase [Mesonia aestuariivivens]